jgi:uncharacterized membrane protein
MVTKCFARYSRVMAISSLYVRSGTCSLSGNAFSDRGYAAIMFVNHGANPYLQDMSRALDMFRVQPGDLTPLSSGNYLTTFQYPALHFLVFVPFVWLGLSDMRWVLVAFEIGVVVMLYLFCPQNLRPMILLPLFAGSDLMINFTDASVTDLLCV